MPTPSSIRDNLRHRHDLVVDLTAAVRLARRAAGRRSSDELEIRGRDVTTGETKVLTMTVAELLAR